MIIVTLITFALVLACVAIHVKVLIWLRGSTVSWNTRPIVKLGFIVFSLLLTHVIEIMLFAVTFQILLRVDPDFGGLEGPHIDEALAAVKEARLAETIPSEVGETVGSDETAQVSYSMVVPLREVIYFSFATYTTVGYGDVTPYGDMQILAQVEALSGLLLVGCSASLVFTFLQEFLAHHRKMNQ